MSGPCEQARPHWDVVAGRRLASHHFESPTIAVDQPRLHRPDSSRLGANGDLERSLGGTNFRRKGRLFARSRGQPGR